MLCNIWIWRMVFFFFMHRKSSISIIVQLNRHFPLLSWQPQFSAKGIPMPDKNKVSVPAMWVPSLLYSSLPSPWSGFIGLFLWGYFLWERGLVATISDINYNPEEGGGKSSQVLSWLTEAAWDLWQSSYNIIFGMTWTWGLCKCKAKKKWKYVPHWQCIPLVMDLIIKMTNYSIKVSAQLGDTCKIRNIITYMQYIAKKLRHLSSLLGGLMWHFSCR